MNGSNGTKNHERQEDLSHTENKSAATSKSATKSMNGSMHDQRFESINGGSVQPEPMGIKQRRSSSILGTLFRIVVLDVPIFLVIILYGSIHYIEWISQQYLIPQCTLQYFHMLPQDMTYYHRTCTEQDQTTYNTTDLIVDITNDMTTTTTQDKIDIAVQKMLRHGVTIIPNLISEITATKLRNYILQENQKKDQLIYVIENTNRWSFPIQVDHDPIIATALQEILLSTNNNIVLQEYLEAIMGPNPAVIEFTAITQAYGATDQFWHQDVVPSGSAAKFGRKFVPSYSLFIPLQDVTTAMGATGICPGTHMCSKSDFCSQTGFQASYNGDRNTTNHIWPLGYGALVNQQTTHRGAAHTDPNGPHRVLFILTFAPRPQHYHPNTNNKKVVETRIIGMEGSYSLHWSHWGHTLSDYQQPLKYMKQPYRTLRTLGIYNNNYGSRNHWGWDYITTSSVRISNSDTGFTDSNLEEFLMKGGFRWLPRQLQGNYTDGMTNGEEQESYGWIDFFKDTIQKCKMYIMQIYQGFVVAYVAFIIISALSQQKGRRWNVLRISTFRLLAMHAIVLLVYWVIQERLQHSSWARNIQGQRSFRMPDQPLTLAPTLPGTLPVEDDVLILEAMKSESLSSFSNVLEVFHPGNKEWNDIVQYFAPNYVQYNTELQHHIRRQILHMIDHQKRRILVQNDQSSWATVKSTELQHLFCHTFLLQKSDRLMNYLIMSLDHLVSETRYGYWRDTIMHQKHISRHIVNLRDKILKVEKPKALKFQTIVLQPKIWLQIQNIASIPKLCSKRSKRAMTSIPPDMSATQKDSGLHWINVGDVVDASYVDDPTEWYRGTITSVSTIRNSWDVLYDDGEEAHGLCRTCVRPFIPYAINETIDILVGPDHYSPSIVIAVHNDMSKRNKVFVYDVQLIDGDGEVIKRVPTKALRRKYRKDHSLPQLPVQTRVMAMYTDDEGNDLDYYAGRVVQYNSKSDTYDVEFDDGDVGYGIRRDKIELSLTDYE